MAQLVKNLPAMQETWVQSLGWEDPLNKEKATSILAWRIPWTINEESTKAGLKLNIQKMKIMASGPITSWQIDGETVSGFIIFFGGEEVVHPKSLQMVTAAMKLKDACSLEEKLWPT